MRVALFGGSFDPPHRGHVAIARAAADRYRLDKVLFTPAGRQPLKDHPAGASYEDRLRMTELACEQDARFEASQIDAPRLDGAPNYTIDTLKLLEIAYPRNHRYNLVGADSFQTLAQWHDYSHLLDQTDWIVVSRPGYQLTDPPGITFSDEQRSRIHLLDSIHEDVAATTLRQRLALGDPCTDLLPDAVSTYIQNQHLYLAST